MRCIKDEELMDYFNNDLKPSRQKEIEAHLQTCSVCRKKFKEWQRIFLLTESYVGADINRMNIPDFNPEIISTEQRESEQELNFPWIRYWIKPALAVAAVIILSLSFIFLPSPQDSNSNTHNYLVIQDDFMETAAIEFDATNFSYLEQSLLQDIYNNDNLRQEILSGTYEDYNILLPSTVIYEKIEETDLKVIQQELNKLKTS